VATALITGATAASAMRSRRLAAEGHGLVLVAGRRPLEMSERVCGSAPRRRRGARRRPGQPEELERVAERLRDGTARRNPGKQRRLRRERPVPVRGPAQEERMLDVMVAPCSCSPGRRSAWSPAGGESSSRCPRSPDSCRAPIPRPRRGRRLHRFAGRGTGGNRRDRYGTVPRIRRTEFHRRAGMDMSYLPIGLAGRRPARRGLHADVRRGRAVSVPSLRYRWRRLASAHPLAVQQSARDAPCGSPESVRVINKDKETTSAGSLCSGRDTPWPKGRGIAMSP